MRENTKHWRKKHPEQHRSYGEKRNRDIQKDQQEQEDEITKHNPHCR